MKDKKIEFIIEYFKKHIIPYHDEKGNIKFLVNDVVTDVINKQQKEIEEKTTTIMAGAEKVKQLEKEIEEKAITIMTGIYKIKRLEKELEKCNKYIEEINTKIIEGELVDRKRYISKDKIREKINQYQEDINEINDKAPKRKDGRPNERYNHENREYFKNKQKTLIELLEE